MRTRYLTVAALAITALAALYAQAPRRPAAAWLDPDKSGPPNARYESFDSQLASGKVSYMLYLPPDYATANRRYPVVYWLHGLGGNQRGGARFLAPLDAAIRNGKAPSLIAVLVNGMVDSFYCDSPDGKLPMESVIVKELIPHIDQTYRTIANRNARAVEGYSMGGYGAAHLGFRYPEIFGKVGVMAGALLDEESMRTRHRDLWTKIFGGDSGFYQANHPFTLAEKNAEALRGKTAIRIAVGDRDPLQPRNQALHELLTRLKIEHEYEVVPGVAHNSGLFYAKLGERAFEFYERNMAPPANRGPAGQFQTSTAPSHVFQQGDVEVLTFETEQNYRRLQELFQASETTTPEPGKVTPLYFRSRTDGSVQPYGLHLPSGFSKDRKYPLVVQLHGLNFKEVLSGSRLQYRGMPSAQWIDPNLPVIVAQCFGRPSAFYIGMGEEDVLEVIDEVQRRFPIDSNRVYIMGHSMGGAGSYTVGLHYPDRFGGITATDAAMGGRLTPPTDIPDWMKPQAAIHTVANLYPNARNVDVFFKHAGAGIQRRNMEFTDGIVAQGGFSTTESYPGLPHGFAQFYAYGTFLAQLIQHPIRRTPNEVRFYTNTLRYNRAYWVTIDRLTRHNADATVVATYGEDSLRVTTTNIDALTLRLAESPVPTGKPIPLIVNGEQVLNTPLPASLHLRQSNGRWAQGSTEAAQGKRHGIQGPIGDAFRSQFLAVYGESDRDLAIAELDAIRNPPGPLTMHGEFPMKPAAKVTPQDISSSNLILFGTPQSNAVLRRIAAKLPAAQMHSTNGAYTVFIYPNPENPSRYVVVWSGKLLSLTDHGVRAGWIMPLNLLPDHIRVQNGRIVSGGHFDADWK